MKPVRKSRAAVAAPVVLAAREHDVVPAAVRADPMAQVVAVQAAALAAEVIATDLLRITPVFGAMRRSHRPGQARFFLLCFIRHLCRSGILFWQNQITRSKSAREIWKKRENRKKNACVNFRRKSLPMMTPRCLLRMKRRRLKSARPAPVSDRFVQDQRCRFCQRPEACPLTRLFSACSTPNSSQSKSKTVFAHAQLSSRLPRRQSR
jgi:hypothetical protein